MSEPPCYGLNVHTGSKQHRCVRVPECVCSDPPPYKLLRSFTQILIVTEWVYMVAVPVKEQERSTDTIRHAFKLGSQKQVPADRLKLRLYIHIPDRAQCLWSPHASVICIISGMKYAKIREIRNQLERCRYVVMSAEAKIKRVEPLSQKFEQTVQLIQDTKEQVNNLVWQELRCKEELRAEEQQERKQDPQWVNE